jgi:serine acetyltransferase
MLLSELSLLLAADRRANVGYPKSRFVLSAFRATQYARSKRGPLGRLLYLVTAAAYRLACEWILGVELPSGTRVGAGLRIRHGVGIVVNPHAVLGQNVLLRQNVTIGNRRTSDDCPTIGDDVEIGAGAVVIGAISIGDRARIGAGAIVTDDVPPGALAVAPSAVVLPRKEPAL